jgi:hypothetical protein
MEKTAESVLKKAREQGVPVLVLVAKDKCSIEGVIEYFKECVKQDCTLKHLVEIGKILVQFDDWKRSNPDKMKLPD